jgi:hypothetical protein
LKPIKPVIGENKNRARNRPVAKKVKVNGKTRKDFERFVIYVKNFSSVDQISKFRT